VAAPVGSLRPQATTTLVGLAGAPVAPQAAVRSDQVGTILFDHGSTRLLKQDKRLLTQIAELHRQRSGIVRVVGHASSRTREANPVRHQMINFEISLKRANTVAAELRRLGVPAEAIVVEAKSNSEPKFHEWMPSGEAGNRRADIFIDY
ncbi:MAG: OmpA family protein, partial [Kiloniellales bacterium]